MKILIEIKPSESFDFDEFKRYLKEYLYDYNGCFVYQITEVEEKESK